MKHPDAETESNLLWRIDHKFDVFMLYYSKYSFVSLCDLPLEIKDMEIR